HHTDTLSLHAALPIAGLRSAMSTPSRSAQPTNAPSGPGSPTPSVKLSPTATYDPITAALSLFESSATAPHDSPSNVTYATVGRRSEEHTSELQSRENL